MDYLAAGTYKALFEGRPRFVSSGSYIEVAGEKYYYNDEGLNAAETNYIVVDLAEDNTYSFKFNNITFGKEYIATGEWSGKIDGLGIFDDSDFEPTHIATKWLGGYASSYGNKFSVTGDNFSVDVHFSATDADNTAITAGEYTWVSTSWFGYVDYSHFTTRSFVVNGNSVAVDNGKVVVMANGDEYTINLTLGGRDGVTYYIQYVGKLNDTGTPGGDEGGNEGGEGGEDDGNDDGDPNTITLNTFVYNADLRGNYYGYKFNATGYNASLGICIGSKSCSPSRIDAGDYTYNQYPEDLPFAFQLRGSNVNGIDVSNDPNATMNVAVNGGVYTITIVTNGYTLTYNGTL